MTDKNDISVAPPVKLRRVEILGQDGGWYSATLGQVKKGMVFRLFDDVCVTGKYYEHGIPNFAFEDAVPLEEPNWGVNCAEVVDFVGVPEKPALAQPDAGT